MRVPTAIPPLVVMKRYLEGSSQHFDGFEDQARKRGVLLHQRPLVFFEPARFLKDRLRHTEHTDVVEKRTMDEVSELRFGVSELAGEPQRHLSNPVGMSLRFALGKLKRTRPRLDGLLESDKQLFGARYQLIGKDGWTIANDVSKLESR